MIDFVIRYWVELMLVALTSGMTALCVMVLSLFRGARELLKDRIYQIYNHYREKGYCPIYARESAESMYKAYAGLRGNGTIPPLMEKLRAMPTEPPPGVHRKPDLVEMQL